MKARSSIYKVYIIGVRNILLLLVMLLTTPVSHAHPHHTMSSGEQNSYFRVIDIKSGLPDNSINGIAQDKYGFIWIGSWNGLSRFDGISVQTFQYEGEKHPESLCNNMVRAVLPVENGIWVGTDNGLDYYGFTDGNFRHSLRLPAGKKEPAPLNVRISRLMRSGNRVFAISVNGDILRHDGADAMSQNPALRTLPRPGDRKYADLTPFTKGRVLAVSDKGVTLLSPDGTKELRHYPLESHFSPKINIFCDTINGRVYIGHGIGIGSVALSIDTKNGEMQRDSTSFIPPHLMQTTMHNGTVCFGTDGAGLWIQNPDGTHHNYTMSNSSLPGDAVYTIFTDREDNLWTGTYRRGLALFSRQLNWFTFSTAADGNIPYDIVTAVHPFKGKIYLALDGGGLAEYDPVTRSSVQFSTDNSGIPGNNVISLCDDGERLWMGVYTKGLASFTPETRSFTCHPLTASQEPDNTVWTIECDASGQIWVGGQNLNVYDIATGTFHNIGTGTGGNINSIALHGSDIWVASVNRGLMKFDSRTRRLLLQADKDNPGNPFRLPDYHISSMSVDSKGVLWLTIPNHGFMCINPNDGSRPKYFGPKEGLFDTRVKTMIEDAQGYLWAGTQNGLYRYNPENGNFIKIDDPRLPLMFNPDAGALINNTIYLGSTLGLVEFTPTASMFTTRDDVKLCFTSLDILTPQIERRSLYSPSLPEVTLTHDQNFFTIRFALPDLVYPGRARYSYRLKGLDKEWSIPSESMSAEYTSVPPGKYTFEVRHTLPDGSWSETYSFHLKVMPPWWATWWAVTLLVFIVMGITLVILYFWREHIISRQKMEIALIEKESESKLNNAKLDFFARISHELRTPVFIITAQIEELLGLGKDTVTVRKSHLMSICRNSDKLNRLINRIIDFRKLDLGRGTLNLKKDNIVEFLTTLSEDYEALCQQKDITFSFTAAEQSIETMYDADCIDQILSNLISNAYKYTRTGGAVTMTAARKDNKVVIKVKDTGIGITDKMQTEIFTPYFRTVRGRSEGPGDGIGLAYVKELAELHQGTITVDSEEGKGSTFTVTFPIIESMEEGTSSDTTTPTKGNPEENEGRNRREMFKVSGTRKGSGLPIAGPHNPTAVHSILIVEDDEEIAHLLTRTFSDEFRVYVAENGVAALSAMEKILPDVVLTDLDMPEMDGHELIRRVRANPELRHIHVAVLTALNTEEDMVKALDEGADAYYTKPLSLRVLEKQIHKLISGRRKGLIIPSVSRQDGTQTEGIPSVEGESAETAPQDALQPVQTQRPLTEEEKKFLIHCRHIIDDNLLNPDFGIEFMSKELAMSHSALYKRVRKLTGMSLVEFITDYRICKAVEHFQDGTSNVQKVSDMVGFRDVKTFRTVFKKKMGMPPKQYVQSL